MKGEAEISKRVQSVSKFDKKGKDLSLQLSPEKITCTSTAFSPRVAPRTLSCDLGQAPRANSSQ